MKDYFTAKQLHLQGHCLLASTSKTPLIVSYGVDNLIHTMTPNQEGTQVHELNQNQMFNAMTLSPDGSHLLFASGKMIVKYDLLTKQFQKLTDQIGGGSITSLEYSRSGNLVAVGTEEGKNVILEPRTNRKQKCRPGHIKSTVKVFFSGDEEYLASLGEDQNVLIYRLSAVDEPQQVARYSFTRNAHCRRFVASFHQFRHTLYLPGESYLQKLQIIDNKWQHSKIQQICHTDGLIQLTQSVKDNALVTSTEQQIIIWNTNNQQKLFVIQNFNLCTVIALDGTFYGMRDDGSLYRFKRDIRDEESMDIELDEEADKIQFGDQDGSQEDKQSEDKKSQVQFIQSKKSKADKLITCLPQDAITSATSPSNGQRFLFVNNYGCIVQKQDIDNGLLIEVEFGLQSLRKVIIGHNQLFQFFDINPFGMIYASQTEVGLIIQHSVEGQQWRIPCKGIKAITLGAGWLAVASQQQIKILDLCGHQIRSICFDREVLALRSHQNLLTVIYHEGIPMEGAQQLAMQLFMINQSLRQAKMISTVPVPIKKGSILRSINFSTQGILVSQDTTGALRAFSLERGDWTLIGIQKLEDSRKVWVIGIVNHQLIYWRTSTEDPQPTVSPRFNRQTSPFFIPTIGSYPQKTQQLYQHLLWSRFQLDHEKARSRLWGKIQYTRSEDSIYRYLVSSIMNQKQIAVRHQELDKKFFSIVQAYLNARQPLKAFFLGKTCLRSLDASKQLIQMFDSCQRRDLAIQMENYCDQKNKELDYQKMQIFEFVSMRAAAEKVVKPRNNDIMRKPVKKIGESIPSFTQSLTLDSNTSRISESQASLNSQPSMQSEVVQSQQQENPFLKKISTNGSFEAKKREIEEHVEKYGIKKKIDERNKGKMKL